MHLSGDSNPVQSFRRIAFVGLCLVLALSIRLLAQNGEDTKPPKYDVRTETMIKGTVEDIKFPPEGNKKEVIHLLEKTATDTVDVYLCPKSFLDDMGISFSKGDEIAMTGSKVKLGDADLVLAREVVKGTDTLVLRDDKGNPIWNWRH